MSFMLLHTKIILENPYPVFSLLLFLLISEKMYVSVTAWFLLLLVALFGTDDTQMRTRYKTGILNGILLPARVFWYIIS